MNDSRLTAESVIEGISITFLNAVLHYALYKAVVAAIMLVKETLFCFLRKITKFGGATSTDESAQSPLPCNV